jgi:hypothetical protein
MPNEDEPVVEDVAPSAAAVYDMPWPNEDGWNPACGLEDGDGLWLPTLLQPVSGQNLSPSQNSPITVGNRNHTGRLPGRGWLTHRKVYPT